MKRYQRVSIAALNSAAIGIMVGTPDPEVPSAQPWNGYGVAFTVIVTLLVSLRLLKKASDMINEG